MTALLTGLASLLVFGGVVLVHELGHFMAARQCGIHVEEFSIGFGPRLWSKTKNGTTYSIRLLPLGGYNLFSTPPPEDDDESEEGEIPPKPPRKTGDTILQVDGKPCWTIYTLADVFDGTEKTHTMKVLRGGEVVTLPAVTVGPTLNEDGSVSYATDFRVAAQKLSVHSVAVVTGEMFRYYSGAILGGFWQLFTGQAGMEELSGPIGTVSAVSQAVRYGWRDVLSLMALLTINVGIFNLLPIPALDGCKLLFLAWEGLTGHPVPDSVQGFVNTAGMVALVWLMVLVTLQDLTRFL